MKDGLNDKQRLFSDKYWADKDLNGSKAYMEVYGVTDENVAAASASRLLKDVNVVAYLDKKRKKLAAKYEITQERILKEYAKLAFYNPKQLFDDDGKPISINDLPDDVAAAIVGLDVQDISNNYTHEYKGYCKKFKLADKKGTLDSLSRHMGMFNDKLDVTSTTPIINISMAEKKEE